MLKYVKRITIFVLVCVIVFTEVPLVNARYYGDVSKGALTTEEFDSIMYVSDNGIMVGYETREFAPNAYVNRAQFVQTLFNNSGEKADYESGTTVFTDVIEGTWYYDAVCWAHEKKLVTGTSSTTFHPARNITTAEVLVILYRYAEYKKIDTECRYEPHPILSHSDYDSIAYWAEEAMNWALDYNILNPASAYAPLNPNAYAMRKSIAVFMRNYEKEAVGINDEKSFGFENIKTDFFNTSETSKTYVISEMEYRNLCNAISSHYGVQSDTAKKIKNSIDAKRVANWIGACHGMSEVVLFDMLGKIDFNRNTESTTELSSLPKPKNSSRVRSGIHYYQLAVYAEQLHRNDYYKGDNLLDTGFATLINHVKQNGATLVDYFWKVGEDTHGHSVVVTEIKQDNGKYVLSMYDPRDKGLITANATVNGESIIFHGEELSTLGYLTEDDLTTLEYLDIDGVYNAGGVIGTSITSSAYEQTGEDYLQGKALITIPASGFELSNSDGETLAYIDGELSGTMTIYSSSLIATSSDSVADLVIVVDDSTSFLCEFYDTSSRFVSISAGDYCVSFSGKGVTDAYIDGDSIELKGIGMSTSLMYQTEQEKYVKLRFVDEDTVRVTYDADDMTITGIENNYTVEKIEE